MEYWDEAIADQSENWQDKNNEIDSAHDQYDDTDPEYDQIHGDEPFGDAEMWEDEAQGFEERWENQNPENGWHIPGDQMHGDEQMLQEEEMDRRMRRKEYDDDTDESAYWHDFFAGMNKQEIESWFEPDTDEDDQRSFHMQQDHLDEPTAEDLAEYLDVSYHESLIQELL